METLTPLSQSPVDTEPHDDAPWGLKGAVLMPVMAYGGQALLALFIGLFTRSLLLVLDPNLIENPEQLERGILQASILPVALGFFLLTLGLIYASVSIVYRRDFLRALGLTRPEAGSFVRYASLGILVAVVYVGVAVFLPPDPDRHPGGPMTELAQSGIAGHLAFAFMAVILAPIVEEILFRGYSFQGARVRLGPWGAGAGVTLVFVSMHLWETGTYWPALGGIFTMAVILVVIMQRTGNLTRCIACHLGYNATLTLLSFLPGREGGG